MELPARVEILKEEDALVVSIVADDMDESEKEALAFDLQNWDGHLNWTVE